MAVALLVAMASGWTALFGRSISVAELNYSPIGGSDYEFVELINAGASSFTLTGARFTNGIEYTFESATTLPPGDRLVICADRAKFTARYGSGVRLADKAFKGKLDDQGEQLALVAASGELLFRFKYDSGGDWPSRANGLGSSLECLDPQGDLEDPSNWRSSTEYNGSPGRTGIGPLNSVVINEVLAHTDPPLEDAIELHNTTDQPVDVAGWYLSNSRDTPKKFRIPAPAVIPARGFLVLFEYQFGPLGDTGDSFRFNSAHGDEAVLASPDASGNIALWRDAVTFEATENGVSVGRVPDGTGPLLVLADLSLGTFVRAGFPESFIAEFRKATGASNGPPRIGAAVFEAIQYAPPPGQIEYLVIRNRSGTTLPLYDPVYPNNTWRILDGVEYSFPPRTDLAPGESIYITAVAEPVFRAAHSIPASVRVFGPWTNQLSNSGERIALYKPDAPQLPPHPDAGFVPYLLVEEIRYHDSSPWPEGLIDAGFALERISVDQYGNNPANWRLKTTVPPPTRPLLALRLNPASPGTLVLECPAQPGHSFTVERQLPGGTAGWQSLVTSMSPATGTAAFTLDTDTPAALFRIRVD